MEKDKMMELDKIVFEWWYNTEGVSLDDISIHIGTEKSNVQRILRNGWTISIREKEKGK